ncbi:hypothetical protein [Taklimakanibacter lacteus]|uniref:hypothetical protein n=1 Tax=Taklimakanibacter lacteus TaxID=2268456 RepID=UPI0013C51D4A
MAKSTSSTGSSSGGSPAPLADDIPAPPNPHDYYPDQLTLYGIKLNPDESAATLPFGDKVLKLQVNSKAGNKPLEPKDVSIAAVYGYSYEGHCYRLEKPKLFIVENSGAPANGCGFSAPYFMWAVRARTNLMELTLNFDLAETLILEANLPGNRSPNTYGNHMQLAHRNGKLNRPGGA